MKFSIEMIKKAAAAASAEQVASLAEENGIAMTGEDAEKYYSKLHQEQAISDEELDNVSGGCMEIEDVRRTDLKCDYYGCRCYMFGRAFQGYFGPEFTCKCSECGQGNLYVTGWVTNDGTYYEND